MGREKNETQESGKGVERRAFEKAGRDANADRHPDGDDRRPKKRPAAEAAFGPEPGQKLLFPREEGEIESGQVRRPKSQAARRIPEKQKGLRVQEAQAMPSARIRPPVRKKSPGGSWGSKAFRQTEKSERSIPRTWANCRRRCPTC